MGTPDCSIHRGRMLEGRPGPVSSQAKQQERGWGLDFCCHDGCCKGRVVPADLLSSDLMPTLAPQPCVITLIIHDEPPVLYRTMMSLWLYTEWQYGCFGKKKTMDRGIRKELFAKTRRSHVNEKTSRPETCRLLCLQRGTLNWGLISDYRGFFSVAITRIFAVWSLTFCENLFAMYTVIPAW
jgi:hypothetical protein